MTSFSDRALNTTRITSIVQSHIDALIKTVFDRYRSYEDATTTKTLAETAFTEIAICDAIEMAARRRRNQRAPFSCLDADIVHSIFGAALDVDRIHDPNFPLRDVDAHTCQLYRMRLVSTTWNNFLLSSPRYWQVLNVKSPPPTIAAVLKRSQSAPLCLYCFKDFRRWIPEQLCLELVWCAPRVQTMRSDDPAAYRLCRFLLRTRTSALQTPQLVGSRDWRLPIDPLGDLPVLSRIRHVTAMGWRPSLRGAVWAMGLKELVLQGSFRFDAEIPRVLSACASLRRLEIQWRGGSFEEDPSPIPSTISLPCLQVMDLEFETEDPANILVPRLDTPQLVWGSLEVRIWSLGTYRSDYSRFMSQGASFTRHPLSASIMLEEDGSEFTRVECETKCRRLMFGVPNTEDSVQALHDFVQELQGLLREPALTVTTINSSYYVWPLLKSLGDQNIQTIRTIRDRKNASGLLAAIGAHSDSRYLRVVTNTTTDHLFESLKYIAIHDTPLNLAEFTLLVETWHQHLHGRSKRCPEEIDLVGCRFKDMEQTEANELFGDPGVTLRCVGGPELKVSWY